ncbi:MAG: hypothetical protein WC758_07545 [Candidatus Woesearchaeota archaeon]|jgi:hypothetical protein
MKEKDYKITYERKIMWYNFFPQFILFGILFYLFTSKFRMIDKVLNNMDDYFGSGFFLIGVIAYLVIGLFILISCIQNFYRWTKQQDDGEINKEEVYFTGNLKTIEEAVIPKEVKFKTIYKND